MIDVEKYVKDQIAVFQANEALEKRLENRERRPGRGKEGDLFYGPFLLFPVRRALAGTPLPNWSEDDWAGRCSTTKSWMKSQKRRTFAAN